MRKGRKLYSVFNFVCPKCHEGKIFRSPIMAMKGIYDMHKKCPNCKVPYEQEPGFFWGAMYIGYGLSSFYMLALIGFLLIILKTTLTVAFSLVIGIGILAIPFIARLSRVIWLTIFIPYDSSLKKKKG